MSANVYIMSARLLGRLQLLVYAVGPSTQFCRGATCKTGLEVDSYCLPVILGIKKYYNFIFAVLEIEHLYIFSSIVGSL